MDLSAAKLTAYGFNFKALKSIYSYINNRKQRVWINESLIELAELLFGVPQRSFFGPFLFIVFLFDLFYFEQYIDIAGYNDGSTS